MTQFANFGALALATTGQHERWPDYAVSQHNWHLGYMRNFQTYMNVKQFPVSPSPSVSALYGAALTHCLFFYRLFKQGWRSTFQPNQQPMMIAKDNIT